MSKIASLVAVTSVLGLLVFSPFLIPIQAVPIQSESIYAYVSANPTVVESGQKTTVTIAGFMYGSGTYQINVELWDSDKYEDRHQSTNDPDDRIDGCKASVSVEDVDTFECKFDVVPSDLMKGDMEDEADWIELYAKVSTKGIDNYETSTILVYCNWCNTETLGPAPQK